MYPKELVLASHNLGKLQEIKALLPKDIKVHLASEFGFEEPEETENSFQGNAMIKAEYWYQKTGLACLADDSGICIEALNGAPGVHSKAFIENAGGVKLLFQHLSENQHIRENPKAYCICVLALIIPSVPSDLYSNRSSSLMSVRNFYEGRCDGQIVFPARGEHGHGYDPIFQPIDSLKTFAEMTTDKKNQYSHRAKAFQLLKKDIL